MQSNSPTNIENIDERPRKVHKSRNEGEKQDSWDFEVQFLLEMLEPASNLSEQISKFPSTPIENSDFDQSQEVFLRPVRKLPSLPRPELYVPRNRAASCPDSIFGITLDEGSSKRQYRALFNQMIGPYAHL